MAGKHSRALVGGAVLLAIAASGCTSKKSETGASNSATTKPSAALLGTKNPAKGSAVKVGFIYAGSSVLGDGKPELAAARGAVKYVNEYFGGVGGRPIELVICADHTTPAGATDCANQMLAAKVQVVLSPGPANPDPIVKAFLPAKLPYVVDGAGSASLLLGKYTFVSGNPLGFLATAVRLAKDTGGKKIALLQVDVPAADSLESLATPIYKKAGLGFAVTKVPLATPDVTPQVQAAISSGADTFFVIGDDSICLNALKALKTLGFKGAVQANKNCLKLASAKSLRGFKGFYLAGAEATGAQDTEVQLYHAVVARYAPSIDKPDDGTASATFAVIAMFARAMKEFPQGAAFTSAKVYDTLVAMPPQPKPLLAGQTFQCNRKKSALLVSVCSNATVLETIDGNGQVTKSLALDATPYLP